MLKAPRRGASGVVLEKGITGMATVRSQKRGGDDFYGGERRSKVHEG